VSLKNANTKLLKCDPEDLFHQDEASDANGGWVLFFSGACREGTKSWELLKLLSFWGGFFVSRDGGQFGGIDTGVVT